MRLRSVVELVGTILVALGIAALIQAFVVKPYRIPSGSMEPTLNIGQRILANRMINHPSIGDIVVFHPPSGADAQGIAVCGQPNEGQSPNGTYFPRACDVPTSAESNQTFIKRVVAGPGDRISIVNGRVIRNGIPEKDSYVNPCGNGPECNFRQTITIPPGDYFMMGDNRASSDDSRYWGPVPDKWVIGVAFWTYWPPDRFGPL